MAILETLRQHLDQNRISYEVLKHPVAYTAQEVAASQHVKGRDFAKVVIAEALDKPLMVVLPATHRLDLLKLRPMVAANAQARLAHEHEFIDLFGPCEPGAMPPFGNLFGIPVYVDQSLAEEENIVFQAGTHTETIRMRYADFVQLVKPIVGDFTLRREEL
jgi:Ala-tRNA(Pro) deacylase